VSIGPGGSLGLPLRDATGGGGGDGEDEGEDADVDRRDGPGGRTTPDDVREDESAEGGRGAGVDDGEDVESTLDRIRSDGDVEAVDRTPILDYGDIPVASGSWPLGFPIQGVPRAAVTFSLQYVWDPEAGQWVKKKVRTTTEETEVVVGPGSDPQGFVESVELLLLARQDGEPTGGVALVESTGLSLLASQGGAPDSGVAVLESTGLSVVGRTDGEPDSGVTARESTGVSGPFGGSGSGSSSTQQTGVSLSTSKV
jgi:hypothetical protein